VLLCAIRTSTQEASCNDGELEEVRDRIIIVRSQGEK
jgi:hypothetical protein